MDKIDLEQAAFYSEFQKICVKIRCRGIKVDINHLKKSIVRLNYRIDELSAEIQEGFMISYETFNEVYSKISLDSPKQLGAVLQKLGYKLPKTDKGGDSVSKEFLSAHPDDKLIQLILKYRTYKKILCDFFIKILEMQEYTCPEALVAGATEGRVYPELNVFGAQTGRFSSSCPNIQQIPKRDPELGSLSRAIFLPTEGQWHSLDWSNQEGRLQVHYANAIKAPGAAELCSLFMNEPTLDMHQKVADMASITRTQAKTINLGMSYGMGIEKLTKSLGLTPKAAKELVKKYHTGAPYLKQLNETCINKMKLKGYVVSLGGRKLRSEFGYEYKGLNALMQGSAADQCLMALALADIEGINVITIVHDEFCIDGTVEDALRMKRIMENCANLSLPSVAEIKSGTSWGELE